MSYYPEAVKSLAPSKLSSRYFLWGPDEFLKYRFCTKLAKVSNLPIEFIFKKDLAEVTPILQARSLFSSEKWKVVSFDETDGLKEFCQTHSIPERVIVISDKKPPAKLTGFSEVKCYSLFYNDFKNLITLDASEFGFTISKSLVEYLYTRYLGDYAKVLAELEKLSYLGLEGTLYQDEIQDYLANPVVNDGFLFINEFLELRFKKAFVVLYSLLNSDSNCESFIIGVLLDSYIKLAKISKLVNDGCRGEIAKAFPKDNPFFLKKRVELAEKYYLKVDFSDVLSYLAEAHITLKSSRLSRHALITNMMLTLGMMVLSYQ